MDKLSIAGLIIAVVALYLGYAIDGGSITSLLQFPAFIIVVGGTIGAVMLQSSRTEFVHAITILKWVFTPPKFDVDKGIQDIVSWSIMSRESGYLALENIALDEVDPFINKGLNLLVDGVEVDNFKESLELDLDLYREHNLRAANVFESMGGYSPTIGILGAVLGLIHAMVNINNPELLGHGIATAFVATIYGVGFANLIYLPIANKLRSIIHQETLYREMILEGLTAIVLGENPHAIENKLSAFRLVK